MRLGALWSIEDVGLRGVNALEGGSELGGALDGFGTRRGDAGGEGVGRVYGGVEVVGPFGVDVAGRYAGGGGGGSLLGRKRLVLSMGWGREASEERRRKGAEGGCVYIPSWLRRLGWLGRGRRPTFGRRVRSSCGLWRRCWRLVARCACARDLVVRVRG